MVEKNVDEHFVDRFDILEVVSLLIKRDLNVVESETENFQGLFKEP